MVPPHSQNTVGVCNQITLFILYYISSRLVTLLTVTDAPIQVSDIFYLTVSFKFINFSFQIFLLFILKCLPASCLILFRLSTWLWFESCNQCILAISQHFSSNHGLCCYNSYRHRLSLAEVLIFSLMFSQALFISSLSFKFSKAANLFEILI